MSAAPNNLSNSSSFPRSKRGTDTLTWVLTLISLFLIVIGTLAMVVLQKYLMEESFDLRQQAAEIVQCNESCVSNAQCEINHLCYQGRCRLADNPGNVNCEGVPDQGLDFGCDHYCADSRECADDFICLENRCRLPDNPDDSNCRPSTATIQEKINETCNDDCASHADCSINMRCYGGLCRLASNPSNVDCQLQTIANTAVRQPSPTPTLTPTLKGGPEATLTAEATDSVKPATPAAIILPSPSPSPKINTHPIPTPLPEEKTALDTVINSLKQWGIPVNTIPIIVVGAGTVLLLLVLIPKIIDHFKHKELKAASPRNPRNPSPVNANNQKPPTLTTNQLEHPVQPQSPTQTAAIQSKPAQSTPPANDHRTSQSSRSTMVDRLKEKKIEVPKG